jgi:hypothetical protein
VLVGELGEPLTYLAVQHAVGVVATFECLDKPLLPRFDVDGGASQRIDSTLDLPVVVLGARADVGV